MAGLLLLAACAAPAAADTPSYNRDIRPLLAEYCFACHGPDSAARKAELRLDQRDVAIEAGVLVAGDPDSSELVSRIESTDPELVMPPPETKKSLTAEHQALLKAWIAEGAEYEPHWSLIPPVKPPLPAVRQEAWVRNDIDRFVLARLEAAGLAPAPQADPYTFFRRLHLDITGLPPAVEDIEAFVRDGGSDDEEVLSAWIDRLMQSPAWGEHRGRYWLDAARYGDTHGLHIDNYREMWPYRDWVIRAFNRNQPFDQFIVDQIAGDLLPEPSDDQLIATGFQRCNITTNEGGTIDAENLAIYAADRVQTFGWVFLGLTTNCAQCHDHKFDPFTMKDYYALAAYFRNTTQPAKDGNVKDGRGPVLVVPTAQDRPRWTALPGEIAAATKERDERRRQARPEFEAWLATASETTLEESLPVDQLLVHLPLNEGQGNQVSNACDPTVTFEATGEVTWTPDGKLGPAPVIQAGSTFDLGALGDFEKDQSFSYGAWVKTQRKNGSGGIIARMDEQDAYRGWDLWQNNGGFAVHLIQSWPDNAIKVSTPDNTVKPGEWQHVMATYDGSGKPGGVQIYVDGARVDTRVDTNSLKGDATIRTATPLRIGQRSGTQVFDGGAVQDVRLYGRTLAPGEVRKLAELAPLRALLATAPEDRTEAQTKALYEHYLTTHDPEFPERARRVTALESERETIRARSPITHIQKERTDSPAMAHILMRGEYDRPGEQVAAAPPAALHPLPEGAPADRLGLAQWVVDPANPLTSRVTVNRFWQQIFGRGIVATPEDFGVMGSDPSHPLLLDWLAAEFQQSGWDVKQLFRQILMSATYRQAAVVTPDKLEADGDNTLLSRGPRFRMDAEMIRDGALAASGLLSHEMFGPGVKPYQPEGIWEIVGLPGGNTRNYRRDDGENLYRRTLYTFWKRMAPPPNLEAFNAPSREVCTVRRERTNTPLQALVTMNDPQFVEAARRLAQDAIVAQPEATAGRFDFVTLRVLGRPASRRERDLLQADLDAYRAHYRAHTEDAKALVAVGASAVDPALDVAELAAWTMICNQVINLDEAVNK